jgi:serine/threonine protein kinase
VFARKIIRIFGEVTEEDILKEVRAVEKLCKPGTHKNIVSVFRQGWLSPSSYYYLDMEFCDLNLDSWIQRRWTPVVKQKLPYLTANLPSRTRMTQIWDIMEDLTKGVAFIHTMGQVHRDLKPRNSTPLRDSQRLILVLYSVEDQAWKIADFGLASEGTSKRLRTSRYALGTPSYRSPELIENFKYTNKVDIWAIGCILYELIFKRKAFSDDWAVLRFSESCRSTGKPLVLPFEHDTIPDEARKTFLANIILNMLEIDYPQRPGAQNLYEKFITWGSPIQLWSTTPINLEPTKAEPATSEPLVSETPAIVEPAPEAALEVQTEAHTSDDDRRIRMWQDAIDKEPLNYWLWNNLCRLYSATNNLDEAIRACELGITKSRTNPSPLMELANLYAAKGDYKAAITTGMQLVKFKPAILILVLKDPKDLITSSRENKLISSLGR